MFKHCPVFAKDKPRVDPADKPMTKAEKDRVALAAALEENHRLKQQKDDERWTPTDTAQDVAVALVNMYTPDKVKDIFRRAHALLKERGTKPPKAPKSGLGQGGRNIGPVTERWKEPYLGPVTKGGDIGPVIRGEHKSKDGRR